MGWFEKALGWKEYRRPVDIQEKHWGMIFDASMERFDAFMQGLVLGAFLSMGFMIGACVSAALLPALVAAIVRRGDDENASPRAEG